MHCFRKTLTVYAAVFFCNVNIALVRLLFHGNSRRYDNIWCTYYVTLSLFITQGYNT